VVGKHGHGRRTIPDIRKPEEAAGKEVSSIQSIPSTPMYAKAIRKYFVHEFFPRWCFEFLPPQHHSKEDVEEFTLNNAKYTKWNKELICLPAKQNPYVNRIYPIKLLNSIRKNHRIMKLYSTLILLLIHHLLAAQSFDSMVADAALKYEKKNYRESGLLYDQSFRLKPGSALHYYDAACSWSLAGDVEKGMHYLKLSAEHGWKNLKHLNSDNDLKNLHDAKGWNEVLALVQKNLDDYEKDFNKPLKQQLEQLYVRDQTLRQLYREAEEKFGRDSDEMKYFWKLMHEQDSINERELSGLLEKHGWAGIREVGGQANMAQWLVIQHAPIDMQEKYLHLLRESVKKGESSGNHLAMLEDRMLMHNNKPQRYGSQIKQDEGTGKYYVHTVEEPEYVNQRRKEVGLGPIEVYVKQWGIEWTIPQKEKK